MLPIMSYTRTHYTQLSIIEEHVLEENKIYINDLSNEEYLLLEEILIILLEYPLEHDIIENPFMIFLESYINNKLLNILGNVYVNENIKFIGWINTSIVLSY